MSRNRNKNLLEHSYRRSKPPVRSCIVHCVQIVSYIWRNGYYDDFKI